MIVIFFFFFLLWECVQWWDMSQTCGECRHLVATSFYVRRDNSYAVFASGCLSDHHLFSDVFSLNICILSVSITITTAFVTMKKCCVYIIVIITGHDDGAG